jgi:hypothetical protein
MLSQSWWEYQLGFVVVRNEFGLGEFRFVAIFIGDGRALATTSGPVLLLHTTSRATVCLRILASCSGRKTLGCIQNGTISGASTEITVECLLDVMWRGLWLVSKKCV